MTDSSARYREWIDAAWTEAAELDAGSSGEGSGIPSSTRHARHSDSFPGYELIREAHRGGQGIVYQALQKSTGRRVAIKATRDGSFTGQRDRARFEREVQVLGQLQHPHIVTIHDSGQAAGGFYFAMDYIDGRPLDIHARMLRSTLAPRECAASILELFEKICGAVHAAHLRGVIHRDLKPGNMIVDGAGEPHVLDFGLSKWTDSDENHGVESRAMDMTMTGQFVGSFPWASPEQAEGRSQQIDIRTDVYSLGVMLYQALTGRFPYPLDGSTREILNAIVNSPPIRPRTLERWIDDELETIILKCLCKGPDQRYQSAGDLGRDITRYRAGEPIEAKRDRTWYVIWKTIKRFKTHVTVATAFLVILIFSTIALLYFYRQSEMARKLAEQRWFETAQSMRSEAMQRSHAERAGRTARQVQDFLQSMLSSADPDYAHGKDTTLLRELLDKASDRVKTELAKEPETAADVGFTIANTYMSLGVYDKAAEHFRTVLGLRRQVHGDHFASVAAALSKLAATLKLKGDNDAAEPVERESLALRRELFGLDSAEVAESEHELAEVLLTQSTVADTPTNIAAKLSEAAELLKKALDIRRQLLPAWDQETARTLNVLGIVCMKQKDESASLRYFTEALENLRHASTPNLRAIATVSYQVASLKEQQGDLAGAEELFMESLAAFKKNVGPEHPSVATIASTLARTMRSRGNPSGAETYYREAVAIRRKGTDEGHLADSLQGLAGVLEDQHKSADALPLFEESLALYRKVNGPDHPFTARAEGNLARLQTERGEYEQAESLLLHALSAQVKALGYEHADVGKTRKGLVKLYEEWGKPEKVAEFQSAPASTQAAGKL